VSELSGRGVGLDVVRRNLDALRGRVEVRSIPGQGSEFRVRVPITLAVLGCLLVEAAGQAYALPMHSVSVALAAGEADGGTVAGRPVLVVDGEPMPVASLAAVLGTGAPAEGPAIVVTGLATRHAFQVDALLGQRDVVVKGLGRIVPRLPVVTGASVEPDGSILVVLDPAGLVDHAKRARTTTAAPQLPVPSRHGRVLVVDDALTVRELQRSILERAGYTVMTAADGLEALARLAETEVDIVLTDVEMPNMDGFTLTEEIRARPDFAGLPVVILTSRASDEDRRRGLDAGADAYVVKSAFDQKALVEAVERLLGTDESS
jgi:two-component system, chemotaxis family, sensor kinase CheA